MRRAAKCFRQSETQLSVRLKLSQVFGAKLFPVSFHRLDSLTAWPLKPLLPLKLVLNIFCSQPVTVPLTASVMRAWMAMAPASVKKAGQESGASLKSVKKTKLHPCLLSSQ